MVASYNEKNGIMVIEIKGDFDLSDSTSFENTAKTILVKTNKILVDCTQLDYIDSSGIGQLIQLQMDISNAEGQMYLYNVNEFILNVFDIADLLTFFKIIGEDEKKSLIGE